MAWNNYVACRNIKEFKCLRLTLNNLQIVYFNNLVCFYYKIRIKLYPINFFFINL